MNEEENISFMEYGGFNVMHYQPEDDSDYRFDLLNNGKNWLAISQKFNHINGWINANSPPDCLKIFFKDLPEHGMASIYEIERVTLSSSEEEPQSLPPS
jgi:hypothetical protein